MNEITTFSELAMQPDIASLFEFTAGSAIVVIDFDHTLKKWDVEFEDGNSERFDLENDAVSFALEKLRS